MAHPSCGHFPFNPLSNFLAWRNARSDPPPRLAGRGVLDSLLLPVSTFSRSVSPSFGPLKPSTSASVGALPMPAKTWRCIFLDALYHGLLRAKTVRIHCSTRTQNWSGTRHLHHSQSRARRGVLRTPKAKHIYTRERERGTFCTCWFPLLRALQGPRTIHSAWGANVVL